MANPNTDAPKDKILAVSPAPLPMGKFSKDPWCANSPSTMRKMMKQGTQEIISYMCTTLYPKRVMRKVHAAMMMIPAQPGTSGLTACRS